MVFEGVLVQVLNRFLGDYVENLDHKQLSVGIWGGDVELKNLVLKQSALDDLDLPVQTIYGRLGKLVLKIPWKNLYGAAFVIDVEDVYLLVVPNQQVKYDPDKEERKSTEIKKKEIQKVEDAKKQEADKDKPKADYTFVEKLITQIIKNVQLNIKNIHIRYEDKVTVPGSLFSLGVTLSDLNVVSTDESWVPAISKENITKIFKVVKLEGFAVYWNSDSVSYENLPGVDLINKLEKEIASKTSQPPQYTYILGPINATARLRINQKPELDKPAFTVPKVHLNLEMENLCIGVSKPQYRDIIALADSMDRMMKGVPYRKYRPDLTQYKGHYKEWWQFACTCIIEEEIKRRKKNWDWNHIRGHRLLCKEYGDLYQKTLRNAIKGEEQSRIQECEKKLDVFNIVIIRQRIELETERIDKVQNKAAKKSWLGWMWGSTPTQEQSDISSTTAILKQFEAAMTPEEKARMYRALDYQENAAPAQYPEDFVDISCAFLLHTLELELRDGESTSKRVLFTELKGVRCRMDTRAAANALKVHVKIDEFTTFGCQQNDFIPSLITSETGGGDSGLLEVSFETNPLDKSCGQRLHVTAQPLKIVYDADTIIQLIDVFKVPPSTSLDQLSAAAGSGLNNIKEKSTTGLQHAIDQHVHLDLKIDLHAPYVIIPYGGKYTEHENVLVINLGNLKIFSFERSQTMNVRKMHAAGTDETEILKEMMAQSYDQFQLELTDLQILVAQSNEDWKTCMKESKCKEMHILTPVSLNIAFYKCLFTDDPRLPLTKLAGEMPSINLIISDARLLLLVALATSIPLPKNDELEPKPLSNEGFKGSSMVMLKYWEMQDAAQKTKTLLPDADKKKEQFNQFTTVDAKFVMSELCVHLKHQETVESPITDLVCFNIKNLEFDLTQQTYNTKVSMRLATVGLCQYRNQGNVNMISTPGIERDGQYLFNVEFLQVDRKSPEFHSVYKSCETCLLLEFASMNLILHQEGISELIRYGTNLQSELEEAMGKFETPVSRTGLAAAGGLKSQLSTIAEGPYKSDKKKKPSLTVIETIKFKLSAQLQEISVMFASDECQISSCAINGIRSEIIVKTAYTQINARLQKLCIIDLNPKTIHNLILSVTSQEALDVRMVLYNLNEFDTERPDISLEATMGGLKIIFLNWFVSRMLNFLNHFQTAQAKMIEASQAAAQTAKENMQNAYAKATKISLSIGLKAPEIIVPVASDSYNALLLDMGHISISNRFLTLDIQNEEHHSAVIDELKMTLKDFKLARIKLDNQNQIINECKLLEPVSFIFSIKRNLSVSWYKAVPDMDLYGKIETIMLLLSQSDYKMILDITSKNLTEGQESSETTKKKQIERELSTQLSRTESVMPHEDKSLTTTQAVAELSKSDLEPAVHTFLRFTLTMEKLGIVLFTGGSDFSSDTSEEDTRQGLGRFSLEGLSIKGRMLTDNSLTTSVLLVNCLLDDLRKGREDQLTRLIERSPDTGPVTSSGSAARSMIDVTLQLKDGNTFADVRVYSFTIILSVDYLLKIADFFGGGAKEVSPATLPHKLPDKSGSISTKSKIEFVQEKQITVNLKIEKPDIILVEHMDNIDTKALVLNSEVVIKVRMAGPHQVINGTVKDLQLYTCSYNPLKRAETRSNVLHPVTISLAGSTPDDKGLHLELLVTDIRLSVSPATIELLNRVSVTVTKDTTKTDSDEIELKDHSEIWNLKPFKEQDHWFLKADDALEAFGFADVDAETKQVATRTPSTELCIVSMPSIILTIEAGVGNKTLPMLMLESSFKGNVLNWSTQMSVDASLSLQMGYYNSRLALWEPLIEPVEVLRNNQSLFVPWELKLEVSMNEQEEIVSPSGDSDTVDGSIKQPVMSIDVTSENSLELTVTKTCLEVLNNLGKAFASAMKSDDVKPTDVSAPYKVVNELGTSVTVMLADGSFKVCENNSLDVILESGTEVPLQLKPALLKDVSLHLGTEFNASLTAKDYTLNVKVNDKDCDLTLPVVRADKRFFPLNYRGDGNDNWGLISDVKVDEGVTVITLRSILQVYNHFNVPITVYYMTVRGNELACISAVEPNSSINIPLNAVYTPTNELFFDVEGYSVTTTPYVWKDLQTNLSITKTLNCTPRNQHNGHESFVIKAVGEMEQVYYENTSRHTMSSTSYNIHLRPAVTLKNCLPVEIVYCTENVVGETSVSSGDSLLLPNVDPEKSCIIIRLPAYLEKAWSCRQELAANPNEFSVWTFNSYDSPVRMSLDLGMHVVSQNGSMVMTLYCPFWMLNKTGLMLGYRKSKKTERNEASGSPSQNTDEHLNVLHHPANFKGPILFSFNPKNFFGKKKASVRVEQGEWSDKFSLDVAGSSGVVTCKSNGVIYQVGVHNQLTYNGLTKQVTFTPYYVIINSAPFPIECQENDRSADPWIRVEANSCTALWPRSELDDKLLRLRVAQTDEISAPFLYTESHTSLLKLKNNYGGVNVDIQLTEGGIYINLAPYNIGMAPALIFNHTRDDMNFWEKDSVQIKKLPKNHCMLYTWDNPSGPRVLAWEVGQKKELYDDLRKDVTGEYSVAENYHIYWVSFLDGMQRVIVFTHDQNIAENAQDAKLFEVIQQEITVSIHGVGVSLVNNITRQEIMYVGIASSGIIWEQCKMSGRRFKQLNNKESASLEAAYQRYLAQLTNDDVADRTIVDSKTEVDFKLGIMTRPHKRKIRRTFQTGLWMQMKTSPSLLQVHAKVNRLQIDNQMFDCIFPVVLAPVPPPKSVAIDNGIKPFAELSIVQLLIKNTQIKQFKYFKVLIQEFHIKVDLGFVNALFELLQTSQFSDEEEKQQFLTDTKLVDEPLYSHVFTQSLQEQKSFYDSLHFSPLKIHVSFSMAAGTSANHNASTPNFLNVLLQGLGVTLTDLQDVVFKLAYFEREYTFLTQKQLISEATSHYVGQSVKQLYVLVLGLDVLGNPYGLVLGITKGVEDLFYEPFQGAIQGPGEFAEGLVLGVRSLFGHTVGGAAGAVSRITGAMGKGIAVLTFDKDYQRKRRDQINKKPATVQEGIARSGKGLVMGVVDGVTGVFTKPISGAKEEGVGGFFKGLGKGAVGLVARPTAGVVDFASGSLDAVKRATEVGEDANRLRSPRFLQGDGLVRPYNRQEAFGHKLLTELEKGKYATTDIYAFHHVVIQKKEVVLLTDKRVAYITHNDIFGGWQVDWSYTWQDLKHPPTVGTKGVCISNPEGKKKKLGFFGSSDSGKIILIDDPQKREELCMRMESLRGNA